MNSMASAPSPNLPSDSALAEENALLREQFGKPPIQETPDSVTLNANLQVLVMSGKQYSEEFKIEAVKQVTKRGYRVSDVCRKLGITSESV